MKKPTVDTLYVSACCNNQFKHDIYGADKDKAPKGPVNETEKAIFSGVYYGWLVGYYGKKWKEYI